jgi:hypothetical protein
VPYYIERTCRLADQPKFSFLGLSVIHQSKSVAVLAGQTNESDLAAKLRAVSIPLRGFRYGEEHSDAAILISDSMNFLSMPTMEGDQRPYAALDHDSLSSIQDILLARRFYELSDAISEALK